MAPRLVKLSKSIWVYCKMTQDKVGSLQKMLIEKKFDPFISNIEFPLYKNLESGLRIDFTFPITALIGPNGSNKSSILRALESCPEGRSLADHWFDTDLDKIDDSRGKQRYIHRYELPSGHVAEVMKTRVVRKKGRSDYFETSRPRPADNMQPMPVFEEKDKAYRTESRWKPIVKNVVYLDFRSQLPAYDILMAFDWRNKYRILEDKKRLVRISSRHVHEALENQLSSKILRNKERLLSPAIDLSKEQVGIIAKILGKRYSRIRLVRHDLFDCHGWTAILDTEDLEYSEAFAGSGEFAAIMLVYAVSSAPEKSLILLDEPETSLHPGAQKELIEYLMNEALRKKHQIIMSTHSPSIVSPLPNASRKLFEFNPSTHKVVLASQAATKEEAFFRLGAYTRLDVFVEDSLAEEIIKAALRKMGKQSLLETINIQPIAGGADKIRNWLIPTCSVIESECTILLDGDKRPSQPLECKGISDEYIERELKKIEVNKKNIFHDVGDGENKKKMYEAMRKAVAWSIKHVGYLPTNECPENLLLMLEGEEPKASSEEAKLYWEHKTKEFFGLSAKEAPSSNDILSCQRNCLASVDSDAYMAEIVSALEGLISS